MCISPNLKFFDTNRHRHGKMTCVDFCDGMWTHYHRTWSTNATIHKDLRTFKGWWFKIGIGIRGRGFESHENFLILFSSVDADGSARSGPRSQNRNGFEDVVVIVVADQPSHGQRFEARLEEELLEQQLQEREGRKGRQGSWALKELGFKLLLTPASLQSQIGTSP